MFCKNGRCTYKTDALCLACPVILRPIALCSEAKLITECRKSGIGLFYAGRLFQI